MLLDAGAQETADIPEAEAPIEEDTDVLEEKDDEMSSLHDLCDRNPSDFDFSKIIPLIRNGTLFEQVDEEKQMKLQQMLNQARDQYGNSLLHRVIIMESVPLLKTLVDFGLDVNMKGRQSRTPLHGILMHRNPSLEIISTLLSVPDIAVNLPDENNETPLALYRRMQSLYRQTQDSPNQKEIDDQKNRVPIA
ncbi:MAG: ankyrin repeat domain-containing protein [Puniceicoccales bacterium]|jgi:ankyrin repeat protein|nr:ankyrin repeat domain-containing protein [Puniceicoccales bacterium]